MNQKRVYRWYCLEGLANPHARASSQAHAPASRAGAAGTARARAMECSFVHDQLFDEWAFRVLTVADQFSRHTSLLEPGSSFSRRDVIAALDRAIERAGTAMSITVDHGAEFTSKALEEWAYQRGVKLDFIHAGQRVENGHNKFFNRPAARSNV